MKNLKIGDKLTRVPLIQGGMGVGISLGRLAGAVAKEGGVGIISTAQIGYREEDFDADPAAANLRAIESEMKKARDISPDGIIGYNVMTALKEHAAHVKAAVKAGADIIISGAGLPTDLPALTEGSSVKIQGVRHVLYEMFYNLVDNAVKYNHEGGWVKVSLKQTEEGAEFAVKDSGIGIAREEQDRIFERFYRVDKSHSRKTGGTGLGLSIVKHGAALHHAQIRLDSRLGEGTSIRISFRVPKEREE